MLNSSEPPLPELPSNFSPVLDLYRDDAVGELG